MYEEFFKFSNRPFSPIPVPTNYFPASVIENARSVLQRSIERGEGPGLVIGSPGTGKTMLCHVLAERFNGRFAVALLSGGRLKSCQALLQSIHYELNLPYQGLDEGELRLSLIDFLEPTADGPQGLVLFIDEAHTLPWRLLDEVRLITNLIRDGQPRVRVVLAGSGLLEEHFASPKMQSFSQRIAARCYLEPWDRTETSKYVRTQLAAAGGDPAGIIDDEALLRIYRASDGIPRLVNQICDHALVLAALGGQSHLNSEAIDEAWADLQQLPPPWTPGTVVDDSANQIVEFGSLRDESDSPEAIPFRSTERTHVTPPLHLAEQKADEDEESELAESEVSEEIGQTIVEKSVRTQPEVDLDFPEFGDPFSEEFAEEELVLNQYVADEEIFADVQRVSCWEGRQIGTQLNARQLEPARTERPRTEPVRTEPARTIHVQPQVARDDFEVFEAASDPVLPEESELELELGIELETVELDFVETEQLASAAIEPVEMASVELEEAEPSPVSQLPEAVAAEVPAEPAPVVMHRGLTTERPPIIIEEDRPANRHASGTRPRKSEFRQLFMKLRRS